MGDSDDLQAAIAALWRDAWPRTIRRVETLEEAVAALGAGTLDDDLGERARHEAHTLTGSLGTFGMPAGSDHARALEQRLENGVGSEDAPAIAQHVSALRRIVEDGR